MFPKIACTIPVCLLFAAGHASAEDAVDFAASLIGRPYVWGAEGPAAFDCSGLTQYVFQEYGIDLPRRAVSQSRVGDPTGSRLRRGDLVFFSSDTRRSLVTHVGIYEGGRMMIDASRRHGRVRRDNLDDPFWVDRFMFARRLELYSGSTDAGPTERDRRAEPSARSGSSRRRATLRVLGELADALLKRPRR